jgi:hypothetical protein
MKRKTVKATYDTTSARFGFHEWNLKSGENLVREFEKLFEAHLEKIVGEALQIATDQYECWAGFAIEEKKDNPQPLDPTTIRVRLPLGQDDGECPAWTFTLTEVVDLMIDMNEEEYGSARPIDPNIKPTFEQIRDGLRGLADKIDAALARPINAREG